MARMIPSFMDDRTPPGERDVFNCLAKAPDDWLVFHSLDLAPWNNNLRTEIDFVILIPCTGILCVEVKSHENIFFDGHHWNPPTIVRSPFKQAMDGAFALYRRLSNMKPHLKNIPVVHCCIFPRSNFELNSILSINEWELIDRRAFMSLNDQDIFHLELMKRMKLEIENNHNISQLESPVKIDEVEELVAFFVPVQKRSPTMRDEIRQREEDLETLLHEQQKPVLTLADQNERVIISGGAGTGKTLLAIEVAKRIAASGKRVGLLCFNQLVGDWMEKQVCNSTPLLPNLVVGRALRIMIGMSGITIPQQPSYFFWENELPNLLEERFTDPDFKFGSQFDCLIIDEAQDILARPKIWQCLMQFLVGGETQGRFILFGDFDYQSLSNRKIMQSMRIALEKNAHPVKYKLTENCRNYRIIGEIALKISGITEKVYTGYMRSGGALMNYDIAFYNTEQNQQVLVADWIREFKRRGYAASEITLLSFRSDLDSLALCLKRTGIRLREAPFDTDSIRYATVHSYKGLENKIIILTDVSLDMDFCRDIFYTGMTRATEILRVSCDLKSQSTIANWLIGENLI